MTLNKKCSCCFKELKTKDTARIKNGRATMFGQDYLFINCKHYGSTLTLFKKGEKYESKNA